MHVKRNRSNIMRLLEESVGLLEGEHKASDHVGASEQSCPVCAFLRRVHDEEAERRPYELLSATALSLYTDRLIASSAQQRA